MRANRDAVILLIFVAVISGMSIWAVAAVKHNQQVSARAETHRKAVAWRTHLQRKATAWKAHLQREAWNVAHPAEVAVRKAEARTREAAREAARQEAAKSRVEADRVAAAQRADQKAREEREAHPCNTALAMEQKAAEAGESQQKYDLSVSGLHYSELCESADLKVMLQGYLLSFKATAERDLSSGDSRTDMNQAITLLSQCQTLPGVYGTHAGAQCESQEENDIRTKMNWDMGN